MLYRGNDANVYESCLDWWRRCFEYRHKEARVPRRATRGVLVRHRQSDHAIIYRGSKEQNKYWATPRGPSRDRSHYITTNSERHIDKSNPEHNVWQLIRDHNHTKMAAPQVSSVIVGVAISCSNYSRPLTCLQDNLSLSTKIKLNNMCSFGELPY